MKPETLADLRAQLDHYTSLDQPTQRDLLDEVQRWREEVNVVNNRAHALRLEAVQLRSQLSRIVARLGVDPEDENALEALLQDVKAYKHWRRRVETGRLRPGDESQPGTELHYQRKLADKRRRIRELEKVIYDLRHPVEPE